MSEAPDSRDSENNWVIPSAESFPAETIGSTQDAVEEAGAPVSEPVIPPNSEETTPPPPDVKHVTECSEDSAHQEPPVSEEPEKLDKEQGSPPVTEGPRGPSTVGGDLEEVSCSSSDDDMEGLRKRLGRGTPPVSVGPNVREAAPQDADAGSSLNLNTLIIAAIGLICIGLLIFTGGGFSIDDDQTVVSRSVKGGDEQPPQVISDIQEWIEQHADQFTGDPSSLQVMSGLLDKVAKENQEIRHMQAKLQAQKEELDALLSVSEGEKVTPRPQHPGMTEENVRLKDALLKEETAHLSAKEELQNLQEKLEVLESSGVEKEAFVVENAQMKVDLEAFRRQIEGFLTQKETLVAESQMLRQELDKQRLLVASMRQDLENLVTKSTEGENEKLLQESLSEMSNRLAMEAQRSETWEKKYVEHAQRRKEQIGEERRDHGHKEWKKSGKTSDHSTSGGDFRKTHYKHGKQWTEESRQESQHEEWRSKKHDDEHSRDKKHRHWEGGKPGAKIQEEQEHWRSKAREHQSKDFVHRRQEHPERQVRHHQGEVGDGFHPRKGQKDFSDSHKRQEDSERGKEHRHHDHNKFWKKLSDHQYRVPEGCSGLEDCARKDGMDLFNVELKPVQRKQFEEILLNYLSKVQLSEHLPELTPLLDGFFEGLLFSHHKIRFKDFVDDVEDFLEDVARKETGNDDIVDDFEKYVYTSIFGEAATKRRFAKKDEQQKPNKYHKHSGKLEKTYEQGLNQSDDEHPGDNEPFRTDLYVDSSDFKPIRKQKTHVKYKTWSPNSQYKESDHKYENEDKHNPKTHRRSPKHDHENPGSFHYHDNHSEKPKYSHSEPDVEASKRHHSGHHFHKQYKEDQEDRQKRYHDQHNYKKPENPGHHNPHEEQKSTDQKFGKDYDKYKHRNPDKYKENLEHKHEKDSENKRYQLSQRHGSHHNDWSPDHKPWKDGDHEYREPDSNKNDQIFTQHYPSKAHYHKHEDDEGRHRDHHQKHGKNYHSHGKDTQGNYHQKYGDLKNRDRDYHHKTKDDSDGDYHHKYNKDHHKHNDHWGGDYHHKHKEGNDKHGYKHDEERRQKDYHYKHDDHHDSPRK